VERCSLRRRETVTMAKRLSVFGSDHRARILESATKAFLGNGYETTSTAEIARYARISKRELYSHFQDKRDVLDAVITELQADIQAQANSSWNSRGDVREVLTRAGTEILRFVRSDRFCKLLRIVASESFRDPISSRKFYLLGPAMGRKNTTAFLKRHMAAGDLRKTNPVQAADDFLDILVSSQYLTAVVLGQVPRIPRARVHVAHAVDLFLSYYGPHSERRGK
jgi:AcrR family transcriptional regulator